VELKTYSPPLPEILSLRQLVEAAPMPPPQIIDGILHQGCKMILGDTSKSNKSWCLLDLCLSVASGGGVVGAAVRDKGSPLYSCAFLSGPIRDYQYVGARVCAPCWLKKEGVDGVSFTQFA
jgi:hypothetical protein